MALLFMPNWSRKNTGLVLKLGSDGFAANPIQKISSCLRTHKKLLNTPLHILCMHVYMHMCIMKLRQLLEK